MKRPAVFLDRDGCINVEDHYITDIARFRLYPWSVDALRRLQEAGFALVVVTNQGGIAKGLTPVALVEETHALLRRWLAEAGIAIDRIDYCPHHPDSGHPVLSLPCDCRKPEPGMILRAVEELNLDLSRSYVVGDKLSDVALGKNLGVTSLLVRTGFGEKHEGKIVPGDPLAPNAVVD
ncbi:MAG: HAD family hydrolase, partial [Nitrospinae bacterium]|nr:HAD family hydrolase [Nitrospinota bacterium]